MAKKPSRFEKVASRLWIILPPYLQPTAPRRGRSREREAGKTSVVRNVLVGALQ
jgi:hypothetical protein